MKLKKTPKSKGKTVRDDLIIQSLPTLPVKPWYGGPVQKLFANYPRLFRKSLNPIMSQSNRPYWYSLYNQLYKAKTESDSIYNQLDFQWNTIIPKESQFSYIPDPIQKVIEQECKHTLQFSFQLNMERTYTIHMCLPKKTVDENGTLPKVLRIRIHKMITWLIFLNPMIQSSCSQHVSIFFYDISAKKSLFESNHIHIQNSSYKEESKNESTVEPTGQIEPTTPTVLDRKHINTAFTTSCQSATSIYVFRREESEKVFLHETCHNLGIDFLQSSDEDIQMLDRQLRDNFMLNDFDIRWNESYCETWARIFHTMLFVLYEKPQSSTTTTMTRRTVGKKRRQLKTDNSIEMPKVFYAKWRRYFYYEQLFSLMQSTKLLNHYGLSLKDLGKMEFREKYRENTHGFSYFVLTSILIFYVSDFMDFSHENKLSSTQENTSSISVQKTATAIGAYGNLWDVSKWSPSSPYYKAMEKIAIYMKSKDFQKEAKFKRTLRMSLLASG
jgi:hypothetical protein